MFKKYFLLNVIILFTLASLFSCAKQSSDDVVSNVQYEGGAGVPSASEVQAFKSKVVETYKDDVESYAWGESYVMMSLMEMYKATQDTWFLDKLIEHADAVFANRDDVLGQIDEYRNKTMPGWGTTNYSDEKNYVWLLHTGMITYPIATFVRIVTEDTTLHQIYKAKADVYLELICESVDVHADQWTGDWYRGDYSELVGNSESDDLPCNHVHAFGRTLIELVRVTGRADYLECATKLAENFVLTLGKNEAYTWSYWNQTQEIAHIDDISHGSMSVDFVCLAYRNNICFSEEVMLCFAKTFNLNVVESQDVLYWRVNSTGQSKKPYRQGGRWLDLAAFDTAVYDQILYLKTAYDEKILDPSGESLLVEARLLKWK